MSKCIRAIPFFMAILLVGIASSASAQSLECEAGGAVTDAANNPGLVADCTALLAARDMLAGTATLNWSADLAIENWQGVGTAGTPRRVTSLTLYRDRLTGKIPAELGRLTNLESLYLASNYLTGPIPAEMGRLTNLESLSLFENYLTGPIPAEMGRLTNLERLSLFENYLTGPVPGELGSLTNLSELDLSSNQFSGPIPAELGNLTNLSELDLSINQLSGPIPAEMGRLTNLESLSLSSNQFSGPIPSWLGSLTNLSDLDLSSNQFSGPIPAEMGRLTNLERLSLSSNQFSGPIPSWLGSLTNLQRLSLSSNQFSGPIPSWLGSLTNLQSLSLSYNQFSGPIPEELGNLTNLSGLYLSFNQLSGPIPSWLGSLTNLSGLDLSRNQFSGPIPEELGNLTNLSRLGLSRNQLSGPIPSWLGNLTNLSYLTLSSNQLSGPIPAELGNLPQLRRVELFGNQLTGCIPHGLRIVKGLDGLSLDFCPDPGTPTATPPPLGDCATGGAVTDAAANPGLVADCTALLAARDTLAGTATLNWSADLPIERWQGVRTAGTPRRVTSLVLYGQRLTGKIPAELGSLTYLEDLSLGHGLLLDGAIPAELGGLAYLRSLDLSDNRLSGAIPAELGGLAYLRSLGLSHNRLSGPIPAELGSLAYLRSLDLPSNQLSGPIPAELGSLFRLKRLTLHNNSGLAGPLPTSFTGLTSLYSLHFGGTGLCLPAGPAFQAWIGGINRKSGPKCGADQLGTVTLSMARPLVGAGISAMLDDPDGDVSGTIWQWARSRNRAGGWTDITGATAAAYTPGDGDEGYYLRATVRYADANGSGKTAAAVSNHPVSTGETGVDRPGTVTFSMTHPLVGAGISAMLDDPDGDVSGTIWQWARSRNRAGGWTDITGATAAAYTPGDGDEGYYLRATVRYADANGSGKTAAAVSNHPVSTVEALVAQYDANGDEEIDAAEVRAAIAAFLADPPTLDEAGVRAVIAKFLE